MWEVLKASLRLLILQSCAYEDVVPRLPQSEPFMGYVCICIYDIDFSYLPQGLPIRTPKEIDPRHLAFSLFQAHN